MNAWRLNLKGSTRAASVVLAGASVLVVLLAHQDALPAGITWIRTPSLPVGLYWHTRARIPARYGELVCARYRAPAWARDRHYLVEGFLICKHVLGLPGAQIVHRGDQIEICHGQSCQDAGRAVQRDTKGRTVFSARLPRMVPAGYVYLGAQCVPTSLDSRYLGLIAERDLERTLHPLMVAASRC